MVSEPFGDGTRCVHGGLVPAEPGGPVPPQPVMASQFHLSDDPSADFYGRAGNPTWRALESAIGALDGGSCVLYPSGMAAVSALMRVLLKPGDTVVLPSDGYYLGRSYVREHMNGLVVREVATTAAWTAETVAGAALVLLETPSNPGLDVCDITAIARLAHAAGALVAVDNTTASPLGQRPLALGADIALASDTKAVAGHSDVLLGHITTTDPDLVARLRTERTVSGAVPGPFEVWLAHRGLGTLDLRLARQAENAAALYDVLREHPAVRSVRWPGSPLDPAHEVAARQMRRFGGVISFELASAEAAARFLAASRLVSSATSFGGLHSNADRRARWGDAVPEGLLRLSCGCEDTRDLVADVLTALEAAI
ncbi:cystathionine gamma-lyase [Actinokineospora globicatena]|uniref:Cystathionine gamma-lyase n=1 Tax=Actinokineospora globicatena TaxID=103729 RepID=A0A9W6QPH7_9PSEU|nr:cystathionine gamma-lyase [Actinokineospora globicatena]